MHGVSLAPVSALGKAPRRRLSGEDGTPEKMTVGPFATSRYPATIELKERENQ